MTATPLVLLLVAAADAAPGYRPRAIYGRDDRRELHQVQSPQVKAWADATVALFQASSIKEAEGDALTLSTSAFEKAGVRKPGSWFAEAVPLCEGEPYKGQGKGAFCSGSLVAPDLVMTAGHCVETEEECKGIRFVFGFAASKEGQAPGSAAKGQVYSCGGLVTQKLEGRGADYALVRLDRAVTDHKPLRIRRAGSPPVGTPLVVIGHPVGLPTKVAGGASIRKDDQGGYFAGNLDTYGGNSGSAVINPVTGEVEGILVRGETDFEYDAPKDCAKSVRKMDDTGRGEDVTLVEHLRPHIPDPHKPQEKAALDLLGRSFP